MGHRRGLGNVARDELELAGADPTQDRFERLDVHGLGQAVFDRLPDDRVLPRNLDVAVDVLEARRGLGKRGREEIFGLHAEELRGRLLAAAHAQDRQRATRVPAPPGLEHRRREERLDEGLARGLRLEVPEHVVQRERVLGSQREHDRVLVCRGLELEVERATELLPQREPPRSVDPPAERRVEHELHAAGLVEEPLEDESLLRGNDAEHLARCP